MHATRIHSTVGNCAHEKSVSQYTILLDSVVKLASQLNTLYDQAALYPSKTLNRQIHRMTARLDRAYDDAVSAGVMLMNAAGQRSHLSVSHDYRVSTLEHDRSLLNAALLEAWAAFAPGAACLGLSGNWPQRFLELGIALPPGLEDPEYLRRLLLSLAIRHAVDQDGQLSSARLALAQALEATSPLKALERHAEQPESPASLRLVRQEIPGWAAEQQWSPVRASLSPHLPQLTTDELSLYAQSMLDTAGSAVQLRSALSEIKALEVRAGSTPALAVLLAEVLLRLGQPQAVLEQLEGHATDDSVLSSRASAWRCLAQLELGQVCQAIFSLQALRVPPSLDSLELMSVKAAVYLAAGELEQARNQALNVATAYRFNAPIITQHLTSVFLVIDTLSDLGQLKEAELLLTLLPVATTEQHWAASRMRLSQARLAFRGGRFEEAEAALLETERCAKLGGHTSLLQETALRQVYLALRREMWPAARHALMRARQSSRHDAYHTGLISALERVVALHEGHSPSLFSSAELCLPAELRLIMQCARTGRSGAGPPSHQRGRYGAGLMANWSEGQDTLPLHRLSLRIQLMRGEPHVVLNNQALALSRQPLAVLMYIALHGPVSGDELTQVFLPNRACRQQLRTIVKKINAAIGEVTGGEPQDQVLICESGARSFCLHPRVSLEMDTSGLADCPLTEVPALLVCPPQRWLNYPFVQQAFDEVIGTVVGRLAQAHWLEVQAIAGPLLQALPDHLELIDVLTRRFEQHGEGGPLRELHAHRQALLR